MTHLASLTDEELIARVRVSQVATAMERELARRLADAVDNIEDTDGLADQIRQLEEDKEKLTEENEDLHEDAEQYEKKVARLARAMGAIRDIINVNAEK